MKSADNFVSHRNTTEKRANQTRNRIEQDFMIYKNLQFLKKLELDNQLVIWNPKQKRIFQRVAFDNERFRRFFLGIDKDMKTEQEK